MQPKPVTSSNRAWLKGWKLAWLLRTSSRCRTIFGSDLEGVADGLDERRAHQGVGVREADDAAAREQDARVVHGVLVVTQPRIHAQHGPDVHGRRLAGSGGPVHPLAQGRPFALVVLDPDDLVPLAVNGLLGEAVKEVSAFAAGPVQQDQADVNAGGALSVRDEPHHGLPFARRARFSAATWRPSSQAMKASSSAKSRGLTYVASIRALPASICMCSSTTSSR